MEPANPHAGAVLRRWLRAAVGWVVLSSLLLGWRLHQNLAARATVEFNVSLEDATAGRSSDATMNGLPFHSGQPSGVGRKRLRIAASDHETFVTNVFIGYAGRDFGDLVLSRMRGNLDLSFQPAALQVTLQGGGWETNLNEITGQSLPLPTGSYEVKARFQHFSIVQKVEVQHRQTARLRFAPDLATLRLSAEPPDAAFELRAVRIPGLALEGQTPAVLADLPAGEYALDIARGPYRKSLRVELNRPTNEVKVEFHYTRVSILSEPADAEVQDGRSVLGRTPLTLDLMPGEHRLRVMKTGYFPTNLNLTLDGADRREINVILGNVSLAEAMNRARREVSRPAPDWQAVLNDVAQALQINPLDPEARGFQREAEIHLRLQRARAFQQAGDQARALAELENSPEDARVSELREAIRRSRAAAEAQAVQARLERPAEVMQELERTTRFASRFPTHSFVTTAPLEKVLTGLVLALGKKPEFNLGESHRPDPELFTLVAERRQFFRKVKLLITAGQTTDTEVRVFLKVLFLTTDGRLTPDFKLAEEGYEPETRATPELRAMLARRQAEEAEELLRRIQGEIQ